MPQESPSQADILFYDGTCGLCHRWVRLVLWADGQARFRFAPLQGSAFASLVAEADRGRLPDSIVVRTPSGELLVRSAAVLQILRKLGRVWAILGALMRLIPASWRDSVYDAIARRRYRWFRRAETDCPAVPPHLRSRFLTE